MDKDLKEGDVVIVSTSQPGTLCGLIGTQATVFLTNGDMWYGSVNQIRHPQDQADLDAAPINIDRFAVREKISNPIQRNKFDDSDY